MGGEKVPFYIDMVLETKGLAQVPPDMKPADLFMNVVVGAIIQNSKGKGGLTLNGHKNLYRIRTDLMNAIKVGEENRAKLEFDDFKFLMKNWNEHTPDAQANELVIRVNDRLREAIRQNDRARGKETTEDDGSEETTVADNGVKVSLEKPPAKDA